MYTVVRQRLIRASLSKTWACLSDPARLADWFADVDQFGPGQPFRFDFGDGDFFAGRVIDWQPPDYLVLRWKFMDIGPEFHITLHASPLLDGGTEMTVVDRGALSLAEVESLREGWQDFLGRLAQFAGTGTPARYSWSETIGVGALLKQRYEGYPPRELGDPGWWQTVFPGAEVRRLVGEGGQLLLNFSENAWDGHRTEALIETMPLGSGTYLGVTHRGWAHLPGNQLPERRRYAGYWRSALESLERRYR